MAAKSNYFRLGLFVVIASVLLFAGLFILGGRDLFKPRYTVETFFDESVSGLEVGSPVKFRGVTVGKVSQIEIARRVAAETGKLTNQLLPYILVRMQLTGVPDQTVEELDVLVKSGLRVQTQLAGITGQLFLSIDMLDPRSNPPLPPPWEVTNPYIPSAPSLVNQIVANGQRFLASLDEADLASLGQNLNKLAVTMERQVGGVKLDQIVAESTATLAAIRTAAERADRALSQGRVNETLATLNASAVRLERILADPALESAPRDVGAFTARMRTMAESGELDRIVGSLNQTIARADQVLGANQYDLRASIEDLRASMDNLRVLSEVARRNPTGLIFGDAPPRVVLPGETR